MKRITLSLVSLLLFICLLTPTGTSAADKVKPTISGAKPTTTYLGHSFNPKKGVTAKDNVDGNITSLIKVSGKVNTKKTGKYTLTYKVTDTSKNTTTVKRVVTVIKDKTKPKITGASKKTVYLGYSFNPKTGVKASDNADGNITSKIKVTGKVNTKKVGTYKLTYSVTDKAKNLSKVTRVITVKKDTTKPKISGASNKLIYKGYSFNPKSGVKASDNVDGSITNKIAISGKVNVNEVGIYKLKYTVKDKTGNKTTVTRTITVKKDTTRPVLSGVTNKTIRYVDKFDPKAGVKAVDNVDGTITNKISIKGSVNTKKPGTYKLTYSVKDKTGNLTSLTRTIKVIDNVKPVLSGKSLSDTTINIGTNFNPLSGITASDVIDGNLTSKIKINGEVNVNKSGTYKLVYSVTDKAGNKTSFEREVTVIDNVKPQLNGVDNITVYYQEKFDPLEGVTAVDNNDGDITSKLTVKGELDTNDISILGNAFGIDYSITDAAGNTTEVRRTIFYQHRPVVFTGIDDITVSTGDNFNPLDGVTAIDKLNGKDITSLIEVRGSYEPNYPGTYKISYNFVDGKGYSETAYRKVKVVDKTPPVITGIKDITVPQNSSLPDLMEGLEIVDDLDGPIRLYNLHINTEKVDTSTEGDYIVTYTVYDKAGNMAEYHSIVTVKKLPVSKVEVSSHYEDATIKLGETIHLYAEIQPYNASFPEVTSWESSDESLATVDSDGTVQTLEEGTVTITATVDGIRDSVTIHISGKPDLRFESWGWSPDYRPDGWTMTVGDMDFELINRDTETVEIVSVKVYDSTGYVYKNFNRADLDKLGLITYLDPSSTFRMKIKFSNNTGPNPEDNIFSVFVKKSNGKIYEHSFSLK